MTDNPNAKYGFGPKTRDGRDVVITETLEGLHYPFAGKVGSSGGYTWTASGRSLAGEESDADLIPLSELVTAPAPDLDNGAKGQEAPTSLEEPRSTLLPGVEELEKFNMRSFTNKEAQATIAAQQALLIALVECKDALLAGIEDLTEYAHTQFMAAQASYPAKATPGMVAAYEAIMGDITSAGLYRKPSTERLINAALAAAPPDDRDARIVELEAEVVRWTADYFGVDALRDKAHREDIAKLEAERDELKRQLERTTDTFGTVSRQFEYVSAKCPPDDVLRALDVWNNDTESEEAEIALCNEYRAWQASKAAPVDKSCDNCDWFGGTVDANGQSPCSSCDEVLCNWKPVDKTKMMYWGFCSKCGTRHRAACTLCLHRTDTGIEDNWTPKEGA